MGIITKGGLIISGETSTTTSTFAAGDVDTVFGRLGDVVAQEGDYSIDQMADVDTTSAPPDPSDFLSWNGTNWTPGGLLDSGTYA